MQSKIFGTHYDFNYAGDMNSRRIAAKVADLTEETIREEIILTAREAGVTDLYLMDRDFLLSAIREKQERMNPQPLTLDEMRSMIGEPVWVKVMEPSARCRENGGGYWEIVSGTLLKLIVDHGGITAYRHKPQEAHNEA